MTLARGGYNVVDDDPGESALGVVVVACVVVGSFRFSVFFPFFCAVIFFSVALMSLPGEGHIRISTTARP